MKAVSENWSKAYMSIIECMIAIPMTQCPNDIPFSEVLIQTKDIQELAKWL